MSGHASYGAGTQRVIGSLTAITLICGVILANWLTTEFGFVPVGFGASATAGTFAAGFVLAARDATQDLLGRALMLGVLAAGSVISFLIADPAIATASLVAFSLSELLAFAVYTPLRKKSRLGDRRWATAVSVSSLVGAVVDTALFLAIAFGWAAVAPAMVGQLIGKGWATLVYLVIGKVTARAIMREPVATPAK